MSPEWQPAVQPLENQAYGQRTETARWLRELEDPETLIEWCEKWEDKQGAREEIWSWAARISPAALEGRALRLFLERGTEASEEVLKNTHMNQEKATKIIKLLYEEQVGSSLPRSLYTYLETLQTEGWTIPRAVIEDILKDVKAEPADTHGYGWIVLLGESNISSDNLLEMWRSLEERKRDHKDKHPADSQWFNWAEARMFVLHPTADETVYKALLETARQHDVGEEMVCELFWSRDKIRNHPEFWEWVCEEVGEENIEQVLGEAPTQYLPRLLERLVETKSPKRVEQVLERLHEEDQQNDVDTPFLERIDQKGFEKLLMVEDQQLRRKLLRKLPQAQPPQQARSPQSTPDSGRAR